MKRILFAVIMLFGVMTVSAQQYDEVDLLGEWTAVSHEGAQIHPYLTSLSRVVFGVYSYTDKYYGEEKVYIKPFGIVDVYDKDNDLRKNLEITAFFISNGNKLHIILDDSYAYQSMAFIIKRFTKDELILTNYENTYQVVLSKKNTSRVAELKENEKSEKEYYSINGMKVNNPDKGIYIERKGGESHLIAK